MTTIKPNDMEVKVPDKQRQEVMRAQVEGMWAMSAEQMEARAKAQAAGMVQYRGPTSLEQQAGLLNALRGLSPGYMPRVTPLTRWQRVRSWFWRQWNRPA